MAIVWSSPSHTSILLIAVLWRHAADSMRLACTAGLVFDGQTDAHVICMMQD